MKQKTKDAILDHFSSMKFTVRVVYNTKKHLQKNSLRDIIIKISGVSYRIYTSSKLLNDDEDKVNIQLITHGGYAERELGKIILPDVLILELWSKIIKSDLEADICNVDNFWNGTNAVFSICEKPKSKCFAVSESGSKYYIEDGFIIRFSEHWGCGIEDNNWFCDHGVEYNGYARCKLSMFYPNDNFVESVKY